MSLSSQEAQASLAEAEGARRRSAELYGYRKASSHLIMWGTIWVFGYGGTGFAPDRSNLIWGVLVPLGILGSVILGRCTKRFAGSDAKSSYAWRAGILGLLICLFVGATYTVMWPVPGAAFAAYPALITGFAYSVVGLWVGLRYLVTGALVIALTMFGFFEIPGIDYLYWMAVVGGGSMILAGFWFRRV